MKSFRKAGVSSSAYAWEAAGLNWLASTETVRTPQVLAVGDEFIETEYVSTAAPSVTTAINFGHSLAALHSTQAPAFGAGPPDWNGDGWIGAQPLPIGRFETFGEFYALTRVLPYARKAFDRHALAPTDLSVIEQVAQRLQAGEFDDIDTAQVIHGDLWSGNVLFSADGVVVIDPAAHGGHGLDDLAMLEIFGCPYLGEVQQAYAEAAELDTSWRDRLAVHKLHHLLQHASAFGGGYGAAAVRAAREALANG